MLYNKLENTYLIDEEDAVLLYGKKEYIKMRKSGDIVTVTMSSLKPKNELKAKRKTVKSLFVPDKIRTSNKRVVCIETGEVFDSIKEINVKYGYQSSNICACCKGRVKSANGYHWKYVS
jgi:hypothetical protein